MVENYIMGICAALLAVGGLVQFGADADEAKLTPRDQTLIEKVGELEQCVKELKSRVSELERATPQPADQDAEQSAEEERKQLKERIETIEENLEEESAKAENDFRVFWKEGLRFETESGRFKLRIGGRLQNDWAFFKQDDELELVAGDEDDGTEFRRARIDLRGIIYDQIDYRTEFDFAGNDGQAKFFDVYMGISDLPVVGNLRLGHFREPFGLERLTGASDTTFMERALPEALTPGRNLGLMAFDSALGDRLTWAVGAFKDTDAFPSDDDSDEDQGWSITGRVTGLPWYEDKGRRLLHLGAAYSHRNPDGAPVAYSARPEAHLANRYINTEGFQMSRLVDARADDVDLWEAEALLICGPFSLQAEYTLADVETTFYGDRHFDGYYVQAAYSLTGEHRPFKPSEGRPARIKPNSDFSLSDERGWGAWELALRYSMLDLDDGNIRGGEEDNWTAGVNWYLNPNARIMLNYVRADIRHDLYGGDLDILQTRFQVDF